MSVQELAGGADMARKHKIVSYLRVSTKRQGLSGLGLEAQRASVAAYVATHGAKMIAEFVEVESGLNSDRPQLRAAIATAKAKRATLLCAKLDRVGRRASEVLTLLDSAKVPVAFADSPNASKLQLGILAVVAEEEARAISARTKAALAAAKARGVRLGNPGGAAPLLAHHLIHGNFKAIEAAKRKASSFAQDLEMYVQGYVLQGLSNAAIAEALNNDGFATSRNAKFHETTIRRLRARLNL